jgi:hypothetical protein
MATIIKEFIYTGGVYVGEVPHGTSTLTLHLWGGAGGGGGDDVGIGGTGSSGQYVTVTNLDVSAYAGVKEMTVTVGGGGLGGTTGAGAEGGENGKTLTGYSGGKGGDAGPGNPSGSGGGGGGATVVTVFASGQSIDNTIVAVAGGGAGGGGAGAYSSGAAGINTNSATARSPGTLGENGAHHSTEGGGGGAGGGGTDGGTGGSSDTGDIGAFGGRAGSNTVPSGGSDDNGSGITPGGTGVAYYASDVAVGGSNSKSGGNGKAVLIFTIPSEAKHKVSGSWKTVSEIYTKISGTWKRLVGGYYKVSGVWKAIFASDVNFTVNYAFFGDSQGGATSGSVGASGSIPATPAAAESAGGGGRDVPIRCRTEWVPSGPPSKGYAVKTTICDNCDSCFIAGTKIRMANGTDIKIEDVIIGDMLKGKTSDNEVITLKPTTLGNHKLYAFNGNNNFFVTDEHPFWTKEGWKSINPKATKLYNELESGALSIGDYIQTLDGMIRIKSIESKEINNEDLPLYNFEVSGDHSYFADRYCVHNKGSPKIICTKLFELGYLPQEVYTADQQFGEWLRENDPYAYFGYVKWASVVVEWMEKEGPQCMFWIKDKKVRGEKQKALAISWAKRIATPWAQHMAYRMGTLPEDSKAGRMIMKFGLWLSRLIGKTTNTTTNTKSVKLGYSMWAIFGILYILAGVKGK